MLVSFVLNLGLAKTSCSGKTRVDFGAVVSLQIIVFFFFVFCMGLGSAEEDAMLCVCAIEPSVLLRLSPVHLHPLLGSRNSCYFATLVSACLCSNEDTP